MTGDQGFGGMVAGRDEGAQIVAALQTAGKVVVFTNGCFDLLHRGHVDYLQRACALGDYLVVGLNDDRSVRQLKGVGRPILPAEDRAAVLAALRAVDMVIVFPEPTAEALVARVRPDVYVKGGDWQSGPRRPPEAAVVEAYGGHVTYLLYLPGRSTTEIVQRIRESAF